MSKYWNNKVRNIEPYTPGEQPKDKKYIKLNTNENPYPPSQKAIKAMEESINEDLKLYPSPTCDELKGAIARLYDINEKEVFVGNGSDEVLALSFMTFFEKDRKILFPEISYSFYKVYAELFNLDYELISLDDQFNIDLEKFNKKNGGIIIANPNAPTTKFIETSKIIKLLEMNKDSVVIIDEAYIDFGGDSMINFIKDYNNLLVVQTLSKSRSLAGIRVGFAIGNKELIEGLEKVKNSFNSYTIDRVALNGAIAAIDDKVYFEEVREKVIKTRDRVTIEMKELGFNVLDSKANFLFISHGNIAGKDLYETLKERGILVRYFNKPKIDNFIRITIGTDDEMKILLDEITIILKGWFQQNIEEMT